MQSTGGHAMTADHLANGQRGGGMARKLAIFTGLASLGLAGFAVALIMTPGNPIQIKFNTPAASSTLDIGRIRRQRIGAAALGRRRARARRAALGPDPHQRRHRRPGGEGRRQDERPRRRGRGADPARGQGGARPPFRRRGRGRRPQARARRPVGHGRPRQHQQGRGRRLHGRARRHVNARFELDDAIATDRNNANSQNLVERPSAPRRRHRPAAPGAVGARLGDLEVRHAGPQPAGGRADRRPLRGDAGRVAARQDAHPRADRRQGVADQRQGRRDGRPRHRVAAGRHGRHAPCACAPRSTSTTSPRSSSASGCS